VGAFGVKTDFATGSFPYSVAIGDVNGDGRPDLAVANSTSATVSVLPGLRPTRAVLAAAPDPAVLGSPVTLTATVSIPAPGYGAPTDSVRFFDGTTLLGTSPVNGGVAGLALFAPRLGDRALTAVYKGDGRFFGSISSVRTQRVVATAQPAIASIRDVKGDQGGQVRLRFRASPYDYLGSASPITKYDVFRRADPALAAFAARSAAMRLRPDGAADPASVMVDGWDYVGALSAYTDSAYTLVVPTLADSNASGFHRAVLFVRATTATPGVFYDSRADSGYSVDNLPPVPPAPFAAAYAGGATHLHWGASSEADLWYYRVYRGSSAGFAPGPANLIATRSDTGYVDVGAAGGYYKLSAVDVNGNESDFSLLTPGGTLDAGDDAALSFALAGVRPNPSRGGRLSVAFSLPAAGEAQLQLLDVSGRQLTMREVGSLGAGRHTVDLGADLRLPPGLYLVRLTQGTNTRVTRVAVLK
jgi:hypothetical protein